jgi:hypothetical protein
MASTVDELSIEYTENDKLLVKQLDKAILTKGAWATVMYQYRDWDEKNQDYGPIRYSIRRYQKRNNEYSPKSKFNISSAAQAKQVIDILSNWVNAQGDDANLEEDAE